MRNCLVLPLFLIVFAGTGTAQDANARRQEYWGQFVVARQQATYVSMLSLPIPVSEAETLIKSKYGMDSDAELDADVPEVSVDKYGWYMVWNIGTRNPEGEMLVELHKDRSETPWCSDPLGEDERGKRNKLHLVRKLLGLESLNDEPIRRLVLQEIVLELIIEPWRVGEQEHHRAACRVRYFLDWGFDITEFGLTMEEIKSLNPSEGPRCCCTT